MLKTVKNKSLVWKKIKMKNAFFSCFYIFVICVFYIFSIVLKICRRFPKCLLIRKNMLKFKIGICHLFKENLTNQLTKGCSWLIKGRSNKSNQIKTLHITSHGRIYSLYMSSDWMVCTKYAYMGTSWIFFFIFLSLESSDVMINDQKLELYNYLLNVNL